MNGTVESVAETLHAVVFRTVSGEKVLVHAGLDTVRLRGRGFSCFVTAGDTVRIGDRVLSFDRELLHTEGFSPMVVTVLC